MKKIFLNSRKHPKAFAIVDDSDFEKVNNFKWYLLDSNKNGKLFYAISHIENKTILLHRFIMDISFREQLIDHKNGNGLDCRRKNMRLCTKQESARNRVFRKNKTGYVGVYFHTGIKERPFQASIRIDGRNKSLGYFSTAKEASKHRNNAAKEIFGNFYRNHTSI